MAEISKDLVERYAPSYFGAVSLSTFLSNMGTDRKRRLSLVSSLEVVEANYKKWVRKVTPNNQLKRQGKPMRRKGS